VSSYRNTGIALNPNVIIFDSSVSCSLIFFCIGTRMYIALLPFLTLRYTCLHWLYPLASAVPEKIISNWFPKDQEDDGISGALMKVFAHISGSFSCESMPTRFCSNCAACCVRVISALDEHCNFCYIIA